MKSPSNFNNRNFNLLHFTIPLVISGLLIINASRDNGGIPVLNSLSKKIHVSENKLRQLDQKIALIQNKVDLIKGPEIDADLLEELAYQQQQPLDQCINDKNHQ